MSDEVVITVDNLSKDFKLPHEKNSSVKGAFVNLFQKQTYEKQKALSKVSFEVKKGEFFGIVGKNGSGKSTLLKLLAGIYTPTRGTVSVKGSLTPFIELGVGFNPELTGKENVFLNGALLGFNRAEMSSMYKDIVKFAELEKFMDQKLKNYSSGMQVRLAFSIAIRADTEVLIFDEVLAVGDERFQAKCLSTFEELKKRKKTIVLVTHDMNSVRRFCDKAVVIHDGQLIYEGSSNGASDEYVKLNFPETVLASNGIDGKGRGIQISEPLVNGKVAENMLFNTGDEVTIPISWKHTNKTKNVGVAIFNDSGQYIFGTNTIIDKVSVSNSSINYTFNADLGSGGFYAQVGVYGENDSQIAYFAERAISFRVKNNDGWQGSAKLKHNWK
jgi:ABC-2 type transport system ATP-binding protein